VQGKSFSKKANNLCAYFAFHAKNDGEGGRAITTTAAAVVFNIPLSQNIHS
jgi:hypothetical protein